MKSNFFLFSTFTSVLAFGSVVSAVEMGDKFIPTGVSCTVFDKSDGSNSVETSLENPKLGLNTSEWSDYLSVGEEKVKLQIEYSAYAGSYDEILRVKAVNEQEEEFANLQTEIDKKVKHIDDEGEPRRFFNEGVIMEDGPDSEPLAEVFCLLSYQ